MKFPDFIIIGAAKCGTTALWYNLDKHPDIKMALKTQHGIEFNFWGGNNHQFKKGIDWYKLKFTADFTGEKSTLYYLSRKSMRLIHKYMPNTKMILCVRNPVDRAYSNWQMNTNSGKVPINFNYDLFEARYANAGRYYAHIENNFLPFFDRSQLHIYITEWGKKDTPTEMNKVFDFLGVSNLDLPKKRIGGTLLRNSTRLEDVKKNRKENYYRVWTKQKGRLGGPLREQCLKYYETQNRRFFDFLGYKIKEWNR